jgi:hypothetical protein
MMIGAVILPRYANSWPQTQDADVSPRIFQTCPRFSTTSACRSTGPPTASDSGLGTVDAGGHSQRLCEIVRSWSRPSDVDRGDTGPLLKRAVDAFGPARCISCLMLSRPIIWHASISRRLKCGRLLISPIIRAPAA